MRGFSHVDTWVFDLDNTLYPASCRLFDQIDVKMGEFVSRLLNVDYAEAKRRQKEMFYKYGTTLRGLMTEHAITPDAFAGLVARVAKIEKVHFWMLTTVVSFGLTIAAGVTIAVVSNALKGG